MEHYEVQMDALLGDVFPHLTRMLTGWDLVRLSHVNRRLFTELLPRNSVVWRERLPTQHPAPPPSSSWKQRYCSCSSRRFPGSEIADDEDARKDIRGGYMDVLDMVMDTWSIQRFSIDLWFAMTPSTAQEPKSYAGGILLGAQCEDPQDEWWPDEHRAFIYIGPEGDLYCSMTNVQPLVALQLPFNQWHHLALTIEHLSDESVVQCVYVNGEKVHESSDSELDEQWDELYYLQLGTGCISGESPGKPTPEFKGWYGFNGVIDECRFWNNTLTPDQVKRLAVEHADLSDETIGCEWSMKSDGISSMSSVICTRPREHHCELQIPPGVFAEDH